MCIVRFRIKNLRDSISLWLFDWYLLFRNLKTVTNWIINLIISQVESHVALVKDHNRLPSIIYILPLPIVDLYVSSVCWHIQWQVIVIVRFTISQSMLLQSVHTTIKKKKPCSKKHPDQTDCRIIYTTI